MKKLLVDLSAAGEGYTGIGHDNRLIFSMLSDNRDLDVSGLIYPTGRPILSRINSNSDDTPARIAAIIHGIGLRHGDDRKLTFPERIFRFYSEIMGALRTRHGIERIPDWIKTDTIWRLLFQRSLAPADRKRIMAHPYFASDVGYFQMHDRFNYFPWLPYKHLAADGFDAVFFPYPRPVRLPSGVKRVVRYHDGIPLTNPDTVTHWVDILQHYKYTRMVARDGVFVCNSPVSAADLDNVAPGAGARAVVIPCAVQSPVSSKTRIDVRDVLTRRSSLSTLGGVRASDELAVRSAVDRAVRSSGGLRYMIAVSSLEPRKNFVNSIAAWEQMRQRTRQDVKFVIASSGGWHQSSIHDAMRPQILAGNLLHVEGATLPELQALYKHAEFCIFPSVAEGFGFAPLEALQMGTLSVVSDLPVFRWTLGACALYCDPYDVSDISEAMQQLIDVPANRPRRAQMMNDSKRVVDRFSMSTVSAQWARFFAEDMERL